MEKFILIDRDGVINVKREEPVKTLDELILLPLVPEAFFEMERNGINGVILNNNTALASGDTDYETINQMNSTIEEYISEAGGRLHDVLVCPENDDVKYPSPILIQKAAEKHGCDLSQTFFITATLEGLQAGWAANCKTAFVKTGKPYKTMQYLKQSREMPDLLQPDILSAVNKICHLYKENETPS